MGIFRKTTYRFDFENVVNFHISEIADAYELVNLVIMENKRLLELKVNGSVTITKVEETNKGDVEIYSDTLHLPVKLDDEGKYDEWLNFFYESKPVKDKTLQKYRKLQPEIVEFAPIQKKEAINNVQASTPSAYAPEPDLSVMEEDESEVNINPNPKKQVEQVNSEFENQLSAKDAEIEKLKQQIEQQKKQGEITPKEKKLESIPTPVAQPIIVEEETEKEEKAPVSKPSVSTTSDDGLISDVIPLIGNNNPNMTKAILDQLDLQDSKTIAHQVQESFSVVQAQELEKIQAEITKHKEEEIQLAKKAFEEKENQLQIEAQFALTSQESELKKKYDTLILEEYNKRLEAQKVRAKEYSNKLLATLLSSMGLERI
ncbi:hypothetical protein ACFO26_05885 [Lactococcus nasutitermitis]|uniref:Uncharacterized protein n=1 Tax=Lactococcus nasutitermitis TaxID=1652957 RepID=A0ABV9JGA9_9LACT|nr:hypothetical protein [Lactococcus nasutitermitis]